MSYLFVHDHKFRFDGKDFYSPGGLNDEVLTRYTSVFGDMNILARVINTNEISSFSKIQNKFVSIYGINKITTNEMKQLVSKADGIILRLPSFSGIKIWQLAKKYGKKVMVEMVADPWDSMWNHGCAGKILAVPITIINKHIAKKTPFVLYVTNEFLQKRCPTKNKQIACSDVVFFSSDSELVFANRKDKIANKNNDFVIGTAAAIDVSYKCQDKVIKTLAMLKRKGILNYHYELAGTGKPEKITRLIERYGLQDNVKILGNVPHEKITNWLDSIDIYIQPSKQEGLPRAVIEAMGRGLLCIGSTTGGIPELIDKKYLFSIWSPFYKKNLANILESITNEDLLRQASINIEKAKNYDSEKTSTIRTNFMKEFLAFEVHK